MNSLRGVAGITAALSLISFTPGAAHPAVVGSGEVRSDGKVEVKAKVSAPIRRIPVEEGNAVKTGDLLVEMQNDVQRAQVETAKAQVAVSESSVAQAELDLSIARREYERNLKVPDLITEKELDQSRDAVDRAAADLKTKQSDLIKAKAQLAVAQASFDDTQIRAPFDGIVSRIYLRLGATPKVADTTILDFLTLDKLYIEVALPLQYLRSVRTGMRVDVVVEDEHSALKTSIVGNVWFIYPELDSTTRMFRVKVRVERLDFRVLPGMLARVSVTPAGPAK